MLRARSINVLSFAAVLALAGSAHASYHLMQIEQVIGGVNGNTSAQAIQLRMRLDGKNFVSNARIMAVDATGSNPVLIIDMMTDVINDAEGSKVLIASPGFSSQTSPSAAPDFTMTNLIPASYLAAGSLTYETDSGLILWRLSWGGAAYTGPNDGLIINDADGDFGPPFAGPLPSSSTKALRFNGAATDPSTNNAADYSLTSGAATFTNNAGGNFLVSLPCTADINHSGHVDIDDLLAVINGWGQVCLGFRPSDITGDGLTNIDDLLSVINHWGNCP